MTKHASQTSVLVLDSFLTYEHKRMRYKTSGKFTNFAKFVSKSDTPYGSTLPECHRTRSAPVRLAEWVSSRPARHQRPSCFSIAQLQKLPASQRSDLSVAPLSTYGDRFFYNVTVGTEALRDGYPWEFDKRVGQVKQEFSSVRLPRQLLFWEGVRRKKF